MRKQCSEWFTTNKVRATRTTLGTRLARPIGLGAVALALLLAAPLLAGAATRGAGPEGDLPAQEDADAWTLIERGLTHSEAALWGFACTARSDDEIAKPAARARDAIAEMIGGDLARRPLEAAHTCTALLDEVAAARMRRDQYEEASRNAALALGTFACAAEIGTDRAGAFSADLRDRLRPSLTSSIRSEAQELAHECEASASVSEDHAPHHRLPGAFYRKSWIAYAFFAPGDTIMIGFLEISDAMHLPELRRGLETIIRFLDDILLGALSLAAWGIFLRILIVIGMPLASSLTSRGHQGAPSGHSGARHQETIEPHAGLPRTGAKGQ
jgi:hypothetical protein